MTFLKIFLLIAVVVLCLMTCNGAPQSNQLAMQHALNAANSNKRPGQLDYHLNGAASGNNARNWGGTGNAGIGTKVWQSQNQQHSIGVGANYGQSGGRNQGQNWKSKPDVGVGAAYTWRFGKR